jgi:hypothetical protein
MTTAGPGLFYDANLHVGRISQHHPELDDSPADAGITAKKQ